MVLTQPGVYSRRGLRLWMRKPVCVRTHSARAAGFRSLNIDLIYGLPKQNNAGFGRTLDTVIAARPDRLAIYSYAHLPALFKPQKNRLARPV